LIDILHGGMIVCFATSNAFWSDEDWEDRIWFVTVVNLDSV
jgi:hypothetical protein